MRIILASKSPARARLLAQLGLKFEVMPSLVDEDQIQEPVPSLRVKKLALWKAKTVFEKMRGAKNEEIIIIAADTLVYLPKQRIADSVKGVDERNKRIANNGKRIDEKGLNTKRYTLHATFIGKPHDLEDARKILRMLSGKSHYLYSGFCVLQYKPTCHSRPDRESIKNNYMDSRFRGNDVDIYTGFEKTKMTFRKLNDTEIDNYVKTQNVLLFAGSYSIETNTSGAGFIKKIEGSYSNVVGLPMEKLKEILRKINLISN